MRLFTSQSKIVTTLNSSAQITEISMYSAGFKGVAMFIPDMGVKVFCVYELASDQLLATLTLSCPSSKKMEDITWVQGMLNLLTDAYLLS